VFGSGCLLNLEVFEIISNTDAVIEARYIKTGPKTWANWKKNDMERKRASDFPQELLNLFDQYVHGGISRRAFLDGAQNFAVGGVTAAALFEMLKPNYAWAVQVPDEDSRIVAKFATVPSPKGNGNIRGYLVEPRNATTKLPVVLVIHENRGLNPYIEDVARRLAVAGRTDFGWRISE
jgi:carboxymethylenebutenolidase